MPPVGRRGIKSGSITEAVGYGIRYGTGMDTAATKAKLAFRQVDH